MDSTLNVTHVTKRYGAGATQVAAVRDVSLAVAPGEIVLIMGPSGSGKTTLLSMLGALLKPTEGAIRLNGNIISALAENRLPDIRLRQFGFIFQDFNLLSALTALENVAIVAELAGSRNGAARKKATAILANLGLGGRLDFLPEKLSGGEKQRVAIARALATSPRILLMDEPLAALDLKRKQEILPYLERLHDELEIPLLYVSHAPDEVAHLADHLVVLEQGRALASGPLSETLVRLDLPIRLGEDAGVVLEGEVAELDADWHLARVAVAGSSLWVRDSGVPLGQHVRVRILARDISLALDPHSDTSILNILPAAVEQLGDDTHPALALVRLDAGGVSLVARITRRSAARLDLRPGLRLWAQIKAVALVG